MLLFLFEQVIHRSPQIQRVAEILPEAKSEKNEKNIDKKITKIDEN